MPHKKIAICHYRIGKTDGVSLEIRKRKKVLEEKGFNVKLIAGPIQEDADYTIPLLEFDRPDILKIRYNAFEKFKDFKSDKEFDEYINTISTSIKKDFLKIHEKENFEYLFIHNIFTHGRHVASAKAFYEIAEETNIKVISVNHDFYWVGSYKDVYKPTTDFVNKYLAKYVPPTLPQITHVAINSINQHALEEKIHKKAILLPDTFDFNQPEWSLDDYNKDFPSAIGVKKNDLFVLQATRITKRKGIELAADFVKALKDQKLKLVGKRLYNGKVITENSDFVLVLAGYTEKDSQDYKKSIEKVVKEQNIKALFISDLIGAERGRSAGKKIYSLWDCYVFADIVTYPSYWEGWGNQLIEAVFARKPIAVFEYPVFKKDIKKEGYNVISFGDKLQVRKGFKLVEIPKTNMIKAVDRSLKILTGNHTLKILDDNFQVGKKFHSDVFLRNKLIEILKQADNSVTRVSH